MERVSSWSLTGHFRSSPYLERSASERVILGIFSTGLYFLVLSVNLISAPPLSLSCLFMLLPHLLTLPTHHSFTPASRPTSFTNLSRHRLPSSLRTDSTDFTTGPFLLSISVFFGFNFFIILFCSVPCGRLSWLLVSFWAHVNIVSRIVSYRSSAHL